MRISVKGRYAVISMIILAQKYESENTVTVVSIADSLDISKIYLEQVFSLLKRGSLVSSTKGAQGGYRLTKRPQEISVYDILSNIENSLFEPTAKTLENKYENLEATMAECIFSPLDECVKENLKKITLDHLVSQYEKKKGDEGYMFYI